MCWKRAGEKKNGAKEKSELERGLTTEALAATAVVVRGWKKPRQGLKQSVLPL